MDARRGSGRGSGNVADVKRYKHCRITISLGSGDIISGVLKTFFLTLFRTFKMAHQAAEKVLTKWEMNTSG